MSSLLYILATGFLVRADGWGPINHEVAKSWHPWVLRASKFFNAWSCSALFAVLSALYFEPLVGAACGLAFLIFRLPGFHGWQNWKEMYWRGLWTSAIGFALIGIAAHVTPYFGFASIPFAALYMLTYAGGYKWLPYDFFGFQLHVWIEQTSGWLLAATITAYLLQLGGASASPLSPSLV